MARFSDRMFVVLDKARRSVVLAVRSLWLHKLRALLSILGIIIGTGAVIILMAFGEGSMQDALEDIKRQGATNIIVTSTKPPDDASSQKRSYVLNFGLTYADYDRFLLLPDIIGHVPMRIFPQEIRSLHRMHPGRVVGTTEAYQDVAKAELLKGRFLVDAEDNQEAAVEGDNTRLSNVCVLGSEVAEALFPFQDPMGETVVINKQDFVIVGILKERQQISNAGGLSEDFNSDVYIPLRTCRSRWGDKIFIRQSGSRSGEQVELHQITLTCSDTDKVRELGAAIRDQLETYHKKKDWRVTVPLDRLEEAERAKARYLILLFVIMCISLLVGGIGIMNIMLATVTERTREIGIRRALGAKRWDITLQFLIEAISQTSVGGLLGAGAGIGLVYFVPWCAEFFFGKALPALLHVPSIFLSLGFAVGVGVVFGLYPAYRASRLDPIEALRHD